MNARLARGARALGICLLGAAMWGCKSVDGVADKHAAAIRKRLEVMRAIGDDAAAHPPLEEDRLSAPSEGFALAYDYAGRNSMITYLEDLERPGELAPVYARIPRSDEIARCAALALHGTEPWDPDDPQRWHAAVDADEADARLSSCENVTYVFVVRAAAFVRPAVIAQESYDGGSIEADVLIYAARPSGDAPFERLGGLRVHAESGSSLSLYEGESATEALEKDLASRLIVAFSGALRGQDPESAVRL